MGEQMFFAAGGALAGQLLGLLELKNTAPAQRPNLKDFWYWFPFVVSPLLGAGLAFAYVRSGVDLKPMLALNIGISAPLVLRSMSEVAPRPDARIDPGPGA